MKYLISIILLYSSLVYSQNYRTEIMDKVIYPCFKQSMRNKGLDADDTRLMQRYIRQYGTRIMESVDVMENELYRNNYSDSERQELYRTALNSCLGGLR